jgi:hypothetical protein
MYLGKVELASPKKLLYFNGAVHIVENCPNYATSWFNFESEIDPLKVSIPVGDKLSELNRKHIVLGSLITTDSIHVYSSFFGQRKNYSDSLIVTSKGFLQFNKDSGAYMIASKEKLKKLSLPGPLISLKRNACFQHGEGKVNLGVEYGQFKIASAGNVDHELQTNKVSLHIMMSMNFMMYDKSMESAALMIDSLTKGYEKVDINKPYFKKNFSNMADSVALNKYYAELSLPEGKPVLPEELQTSIFFSDVKLVWDDYSNSYRSIGKIGLGYFNKKAINKYVEGYVEVWRKRTGDIFDLYLKINDNLFYYFGYTRGNMHVLSSDNTGFNDPIRMLKESERTMKTPRGKTPYSFLVSIPRKYQTVVNRWKSLKEGKKDEKVEEEQPDNTEEQKEEKKPEEIKTDENLNQ